MKIHKIKMIRYKKQHEIFKYLIQHIQFTISVDADVLIANESLHLDWPLGNEYPRVP